MAKAKLIFLLAVLLISAFTFNPSQAATTGAPSAPQGITQSSNTTGITLNWTAPAYTGTNGVTSYQIEYSTNGSTWTVATSVSSSTFTYTVGGLTPSTTYYFRIAAFSNATRGANGYPWMKIYGTTSKSRNSSNGVDYETGFGLNAGDSSTVVSDTFTRIRYRLETTINSAAKYADVDFEKWVRGNTDSATAKTQWDPTVASLRIPTTVSGSQYTIQANVNDLNVYSDNTNVSNGYGMLGRLEIWPWNYDIYLSGLKPAGSNAVYDYDDYPSINSYAAASAGSYGSFQVHDVDNQKPVFVWNRQDYGGAPEIAYGKNPVNHPDWTFCSDGYGSCPQPTSFKLQIYVNSPITTSANLVTTASVSVSATPEYRKPVTISYTTTTPGKVTFLEAGRVILGCKNIAVTSSASCSWKPSRRNAITVTARLVPTNVALTTVNTNQSVFILGRTSAR